VVDVSVADVAVLLAPAQSTAVAVDEVPTQPVRPDPTVVEDVLPTLEAVVSTALERTPMPEPATRPEPTPVLEAVADPTPADAAEPTPAPALAEPVAPVATHARSGGQLCCPGRDLEYRRQLAVLVRLTEFRLQQECPQRMLVHWRLPG
jgi:hypothetical protein